MAQQPLQNPAAVPHLPVSGWLPAHTQALLDDMLEGYTLWRMSRRHTLKAIQSDLNTVADFLRYANGIPGQLTPGDFERWAAHLWRDRQVAASTQRKYQAVVRVFFDYLMREPRYRNRVRQALGADIVQVCTPENCILHRAQVELSEAHGRRSFTSAEVETLFAALDREIEYAWAAENGKSLVALQRNKALIWVLYKLGLRADEALGLNTDSFEPNPAFPELGAYGFARVFGKGAKWRTVTVTDPTVAAMLQWYAESVRPRYLGKAAPGEKALFLSEQGRRLGYSGFHREYVRLLDCAGVDRQLTPHCLRHTSVSENDIEGLSLNANRLQHGHTFAATTQGYMHHPDAFVKEQFSRIIRKNLHKTAESDRK